MKTIKTVDLVLRAARERSYVIELVELERGAPKNFLVNYRYGFTGSPLKEGTRTPDPVDRSTAELMFRSLLQSRQTQGYEEAGEPSPWKEEAAGPRQVREEIGDPRSARLLYLLDRAGSMADESAAKLIWRIGQVRVAPATKPLAEFRHDAGPVARRVLPYALYRCGQDRRDTMLPALEALAGDDDPVVRIPARIALSDLSEPQREVRRLGDGLPPTVAAALQGPLDAAPAQILGYLGIAATQGEMTRPPKGSDFGAEQQQALIDLYLLSRHAEESRPLFLAVLRQVPFAPFLFRGLRRVFKAAEAFDDAEVFALFARRFDETRPGYSSRWNWHRGRRIDRSALGSEDAPLAWSDTTRAYFRRRIWRDLRKRGELGDPSYVDLATACLLETGDGGEEAGSASRHDGAMRRTIRIHYPPLSRRFALHHIMHGNGERLRPKDSALIWHYDGEPREASGREESFPRLWDARPDALMRLVLDAPSEQAVGFAARALIDNTSFCLALPAETVARLLRRTSDDAHEFALEVARMQLARRSETVNALIPALFASGRREAVELAETALTLKPELATRDDALAAELFLAVSPVTFDWLDGFWTQHAASADLPELIDALAYQAERFDWDHGAIETEKERVRLAADLLTRHFGDAIRNAREETLIALSKAEDVPPKLLAILLASARPDGVRTFDPAALAEEEDADLQAAGARLLAGAGLDELRGREELILAFLKSAVADSRDAAVAAADRLGTADRASAEALAAGIVPILFRAESHEGVREDAVRAARTSAIAAALVRRGPDLVWALLRAKAEPARRVGSELLEQLGSNTFSLRKTARIGTNDQAIARRWAVAALSDRIDQVAAEPEQIFALLDGPWEDSREAAYDMIRTRLDPSEWQPETVVALCDCVTPPAQAFGREMLARAFADANADIFLRRLSEHPSNGFRLTVARLIREYAGGDPARLRAVEPALRTILSRVFSSRAAKHQAYAFVAEEIERGDPAALAIFGDLLERISATCAVGDRARILSLIVRLKEEDPALVTAARIVEPEIREAARWR